MSVEYDAGPTIRFNVIGEAWRLYKSHALVWSLAMLIVMAVYALVGGALLGSLGAGKPLRPGGFRLFLPASRSANRRLDRRRRFLAGWNDPHGAKSDSGPDTAD